MTYFEQPDVRHMNEIIVWLYTDSKIYSFATTKSLNDYIDGSGEAGEELSPAFKVSSRTYSKVDRVLHRS